MEPKSRRPLIVALSLMMLASAVLGWQLAQRVAVAVQPPDPYPPVLLIPR